MKINLYILLLAFVFPSLNCKNNNLKTQGYWIGIYSEYHRTYFSDGDGDPALVKKHNGYIIDTVELKKVLSFNKDTMTLASFNETVYHGYSEYKFNFDFDKDSIKLEYEEEEIAINYSFNNERFLILYSENIHDSKYGDYFIQIEEFEMANKQNEISSFLTTNPIILGNRSDKIELAPPQWHHMGEFIQDSLEADYGYGNDWYFYSLGKELFLIIGNQLIHVSDFDNQKLYGYTYDRKISEIEITKSNYDKKINIEYLLGKWTNLENPLNKDDIDKNQKLEINNNNIIITTNEFSDTLRWKLNKYRNKILRENDHRFRYGDYWKIQSLSNEQLILKRKIIDKPYSNVETIILKRE